MTSGCIHVGRELAQSLVKVVHLRHNAAYDHDDEHVGRGMCELIVPVESHFQSNAKGLDGHDGDGSGSRADGQIYQRVFAAVLGGNLVNHDGAEGGDKGTVEEEA